jgi:hypothetical protein
MVTIEVRWSEEGLGTGHAEWRGWERSYETTDPMEAIESAFHEWLDEKVRGRNLVLRELEFHVDGEYQIWRKEEYAHWMQRAVEATR